MSVESITKTLGAGSGIDISALVTSLVDAQFAVKNDALTAREERLEAQISGLGQLKSGITGFASALATLVEGGSLATQPTSSDTGILAVSLLSNARIAELNASIEVRQLATAQAANTASFADRTAPIGTGTLTLTFGEATIADGAMTGFTAGGGTPITITIDATNNSLEGIAQAINAADAGVTATILSDVGGSRLVLKGATGASQAFTLTATEDAGAPGLSQLDIGVGATGTTIGAAAQDAVVVVDGVAIRRASNSINNLIEGVKLDLVSAVPGETVTLGSRAPTAELRQAVNDVVATYNEFLGMLKEQTDTVSGALRADPAAKALARSLRELTLTPLVADTGDGAPTTLAGIGVTTNRDGTLSVDAAKLAKALTAYPETIEAMFAQGSGASGNGLSAALDAIAERATDRTYGLGASEARYEKAQDRLEDEQLRLADATEAMRERMTRQFASMDAKVAAYKSTQSFLEQQIDAWNAQG